MSNCENCAPIWLEILPRFPRSYRNIFLFGKTHPGCSSLPVATHSITLNIYSTLDWNTVMFPFLKHNKNKLFLAVALKRSKMCSECIFVSWRKEWCDIKHGLFRSRIGPPEGTVVHPTDVTPSDWEDRREAEEVWVTERETERVTDWKRERQMMKEA